MKQEIKPVQLKGDELMRTQASMKASFAQLEYIAQIVGEKLGRRSMAFGPDGVTQVRIDPSAGVITFMMDGDMERGCIQYRDPPGVCEPCPK